MKLKNILYYLIVIVILTPQLWASNTNPVVTNVSITISDTIVSVIYDVADAEQSLVSILMEVSSDNGLTWDYNYGVATGNIGDNIPVGTNKTINWIYSGSYNDQFKIRIVADDDVGDQIYYSGKIYNTVTMGSQIWLKENLDTENRSIHKYCYNNDPINCSIYGGLYNWNEAMQYVRTPGARGICPIGWHIPTQTDFYTFRNSYDGLGLGLLAIGQGAGTNTTGFSGMLGGCDNVGLGALARFWLDKEMDSAIAVFMELGYNGSLGISFNLKTMETSIRCIKN